MGCNIIHTLEVGEAAVLAELRKQSGEFLLGGGGDKGTLGIEGDGGLVVVGGERVGVGWGGMGRAEEAGEEAQGLAVGVGGGKDAVL